MNIDFINQENVKCVRLGLDSGTILEDNTYLNKLREVFQKHDMRRVWAQGMFCGYREAGVRFWFENIELNLAVERELSEVVETYEYITGGRDKKCKYFNREITPDYYVDYSKEVIYLDGVFYANGRFGLVQEHNSTLGVEKEDMQNTILTSIDSLDGSPFMLYALQRIYRVSVFLFSKLGFIAHACPEYVDTIYPYMRTLRRIVANHESRCAELNDLEIALLKREVLPTLRKDVSEAHER